MLEAIGNFFAELVDYDQDPAGVLFFWAVLLFVLAFLGACLIPGWVEAYHARRALKIDLAEMRKRRRRASH